MTFMCFSHPYHKSLSYVLSLPYSESSRGGVRNAYAFSSPVNVLAFEIRYRFSIISPVLFKSSSSYFIMVSILDHLLAASVVYRYRAGLWYPGFGVQTRSKSLDFSGRKPQHAFLRRGNKAVCPIL